MRSAQMKRGEKTRYDGRCRTRTEPREGVNPVVRFRNPQDGDVVVDDQVRGRVVFQNKELDDLISAWTLTLDSATLEKLMEDHGIPSGRIYTPAEMLEDAHFKAREAIVTTMHPTFGELKMQNVAPKLSKTPGNIRRPGPELGQHNSEIYGEVLAMTVEQMAELEAKGII